MKIKERREMWSKRKYWVISSAPFGFIGIMGAIINNHHASQTAENFWGMLGIHLLMGILIPMIILSMKQVRHRAISVEPPQPLTLKKYLSWVFVFQTEFAITLTAATYALNLLFDGKSPDVLQIFAVKEIYMLVSGLILAIGFWRSHPQFFASTAKPPVKNGFEREGITL